uniref:basic proline-rich protein-like n=1 Tax=Odobenus rosmarus divergens TaxID=9708 RepID=UPI00063CFA40|nr:PREDICTED: basic proline-rich protein-like [Odobenus rosmarus divergens]
MVPACELLKDSCGHKPRREGRGLPWMSYTVKAKRCRQQPGGVRERQGTFEDQPRETFQPEPPAALKPEPRAAPGDPPRPGGAGGGALLAALAEAEVAAAAGPKGLGQSKPKFALRTPRRTAWVRQLRDSSRAGGARGDPRVSGTCAPLPARPGGQRTAAQEGTPVPPEAEPKRRVAPPGSGGECPGRGRWPREPPTPTPRPAGAPRRPHARPEPRGRVHASPAARPCRLPPAVSAPPGRRAPAGFPEGGARLGPPGPAAAGGGGGGARSRG